jgi:putative membrane protein
MAKSIVFLTAIACLSAWLLYDNSSFGAGQIGVQTPARHLTVILNDQDKEFISSATIGGLFEIQESQIITQKSSTDVIKKFADRMISDHTKVNSDLATLAASKGDTVPTILNDKYQKKVDDLSTLAGSDLDKTYVRDQVSAHKDAVDLFTKESTDGQDVDLKNFAAANLPTLQHHLAMAEDLENTIQ